MPVFGSGKSHGNESDHFQKLFVFVFTPDVLSPLPPKNCAFLSFVTWGGLAKLRTAFAAIMKNCTRDVTTAKPLWDHLENGTATGYINSHQRGHERDKNPLSLVRWIGKFLDV